MVYENLVKRSASCPDLHGIGADGHKGLFKNNASSFGPLGQGEYNKIVEKDNPSQATSSAFGVGQLEKMDCSVVGPNEANLMVRPCRSEERMQEVGVKHCFQKILEAIVEKNSDKAVLEDKAEKTKKKRNKKSKGLRWMKSKAGRKYAEVALWKNNRSQENCVGVGGNLSTVYEDLSWEGEQDEVRGRICSGLGLEIPKVTNCSSPISPGTRGLSYGVGEVAGSEVGLQGILKTDISEEKTNFYDKEMETAELSYEVSGHRSQQQLCLIRRKTASVGLICSSGSSETISVFSQNRWGDSECDSDIRNCNLRLLGQSAERVAAKVWEIGKSIRVTKRGN